MELNVTRKICNLYCYLRQDTITLKFIAQTKQNLLLPSFSKSKKFSNLKFPLLHFYFIEDFPYVDNLIPNILLPKSHYQMSIKKRFN